MNRQALRALLALLTAALCAGLITACGDAEESAGAPAAATLLDETLAATSKLRSGRFAGRLQLDPDGLLALGGPIVLSGSGPFAAPEGEAGPRFDLALAAAIGGQTFKGGASSTGSRTYLRLDDRSYLLGRHGKRAKTAAKRGGLAVLNLDPSGWVKSPQTTSQSAPIDGVETVTIKGQLDVARMLADVAKLLDGGKAGGGLLTPKLRRQISGAVKSATVEVAAGADDKILRRLTAFIDFTFPKDEQPPITGLDGGKINLRVNLTDVNATTFDVAKPAGARPLSRLLGDEGIGGFLRGLGASIGAGQGAGDGGAAFLRCVNAAAGRSDEVMRCASKLAP